MAKAQTKATEKYRAKKGIITKSIKISRELNEQFIQACERAGISQAQAFKTFMEQFITAHQE
ncbi:chemotaxis protein [Dubosiella muris]|uniref:Chemotaxis protein n=2 Tax=Dubosiella TaxID=1937008 RepID=A0AC61R9G4_9FIRM|nr:chemotaxis protein [Dubosiella muris]TGY66916.1 chemotaxis protein [Dubosiella muris]